MDGINANTFVDAASTALQLERFLPEPLAKAASFAANLAGAKEEMTINLAPEYQELLNKQMEVQWQLQQATYASNIERANHEARMAPVRNMHLN